MLAIAVGALFAAVASAGELARVDKEDTVLYKIEKAVAAGELDYDTALVYRYFALSPVGMEYVPVKYRAEWYAAEPVDGTPVWLELQDRWPAMKPAAKQKVIELWGADPFQPPMKDGGTHYRELPGFHTYSNYGGFPVFHYDSPAGIGGNFRIHWVEQGPHQILDKTDANHNGIPDMVEEYAKDAEYAWDVYKNHKWFYHPDQNDQKYMPLRDYYAALSYPPDEEWDYGGNDKWDLYLGAFTGNVLGQTTSDPFDFPTTYRNDRSPYFLERNKHDSPIQQNPERVTVAHELNHGVQYMHDAVEQTASGTPRWYFECTAVWAQNEVYPGNPEAIAWCNRYLGNTLVSLDNDGSGGYASAIWNFFLNDWTQRYWKAPEWTPLTETHDGVMVRNVWRALSKGDEWYTDDPMVDRESKEAVGYLAGLHHRNYQYLEGRAFKDTFELWTTWNWFAGGRDDGKHYKLGPRYTTITPQNTWETSDYPIVNYKPPTEAYYMNHLGHGFYRFNNPPNWPAALIYFEGDEANDPNSKDWGGSVLVTKNGSTWTDLGGKAGQTTPMFTPNDKGIIQIRNPDQYQAIVMIMSNTAYVGDKLPFKYSFVSASDLRAPAAGAGVAILQSNPAYIELLVGSDEELFGTPEAEVYFTSDSGEKRAELVPMAAAPGNKNFQGTYLLDVGDTGNGRMVWKLADKAGNFVSGQKNFSAGFLASGGGAIGDGKASLRVSSGALGKATLFLITPRDGYDESSVAAKASLPDGEHRAVETVGPVYDYAPSWARLAKPAEIILSYDGLNVSREDYLSVYRWNGSNWEDLGGTIDKRGRRVNATADRLGAFVLGYGEKKGSMPPSGKPAAFGLYQNYPNPARDGTVIAYALPASTEVTLTVYDLSGRRVATIVNQNKLAGAYKVEYALRDDAGRPLPAGVYLYRLEAGADVATKKMVVAR
jgi:hypothetical protein